MAADRQGRDFEEDQFLESVAFPWALCLGGGMLVQWLIDPGQPAWGPFEWVGIAVGTVWATVNYCRLNSGS